MNSNDLQKTMNTLSNVTTIMANMSENKKERDKEREKKIYREGNQTSQPHNQTVEVKVGDQGTAAKPVIVKEKKETHIHKPFPDGRNLSPEECEVEKLRIQQEHDIEIAKLDHEKWRILEDEKWAREVAEEKKKEVERQREENKKLRRALLIYGGFIVVGVAGYCAYDYYSNRRNARSAELALPAPEGSVNVTWNNGNSNMTARQNARRNARRNESVNGAVEAEGTVS